MMQGFGGHFRPTRITRTEIHSHSDQIEACNRLEAKFAEQIEGLAKLVGEELIADARKAMLTHDMAKVDAELKKITPP